MCCETCGDASLLIDGDPQQYAGIVLPRKRIPVQEVFLLEVGDGHDLIGRPSMAPEKLLRALELFHLTFVR